MTVKDLERLYDYGSSVERYLRNFLSKLTDEDLDRMVEYQNPRGERRTGILGDLFQHGLVHGVHHRGQFALLLRTLGHIPGNFDLLFYDAERGSVSAW